jgi:hypothetical protein
MEYHGGMISAGKTSDLFTRALWQCCQQSSSSKAGGTGEGNYEFCLTNYFFHTLKGCLLCHKILQHGADDFIFSPKEGVPWILSLLKMRYPWLGLNT